MKAAYLLYFTTHNAAMRVCGLVLALVVLALLPARATNYYLSNAGSDANAGTSPLVPLATLTRLAAYTFQAGDTIFLKRGDVYRGTLTLHQSGTAAANIVIRDYGNGTAMPVVSGADRLFGWLLQSGGTWYATCNRRPARLFASDAPLTLARYPNGTALLTVDNATATTGLTDAAANKAPNYWAGATLRLRTDDRTWERTTVAASSSAVLAFASPLATIPKTNWGYYLENLRTELDAPNEWFYDSTASRMYFIPPANVIPNNLTMEGSVLDYGIAGDVHHVQIINIRFDKQRIAGVSLAGGNGSYTNNHDNTLRGCFFYGQGNYGAFLAGANAKVQSCTFSNIDGQGLHGEYLTAASITQNTFKRIGLHEGQSIAPVGDDSYTALYVTAANNARIAANAIDSVGFAGIHLDGTGFIVTQNTVSNTLQKLNDGAAIWIAPTTANLATNGQGTVTRNFISKVDAGLIGTFGRTAATYAVGLGNGVQHVRADSNTIYSNKGGGFLLNTGTHDHSLAGNVVYGASVGLVFADNTGTGSVYNNTVEHNIFYALDTAQVTVSQRAAVGSSQVFNVGTLDYNYYCQPFRANKTCSRTLSATTTYYTLPTWQTQTAQDGHSQSSYYTWIYPVNNAQLFANNSPSPKTFTLTARYADLDNNIVCNTLTLPPYYSTILINNAAGACVVATDNASAALNTPVLLYPNPVSIGSAVRMGGDEGAMHDTNLTTQRITVFDAFGTLVYTAPTATDSTDGTTIPAGVLRAAGIYFVVVGEHTAAKLVVVAEGGY